MEKARKSCGVAIDRRIAELSRTESSLRVTVRENEVRPIRKLPEISAEFRVKKAMARSGVFLIAPEYNTFD